MENLDTALLLMVIIADGGGHGDRVRHPVYRDLYGQVAHCFSQ